MCRHEVTGRKQGSRQVGTGAAGMLGLVCGQKKFSRGLGMGCEYAVGVVGDKVPSQKGRGTNRGFDLCW